MRKDFKPMEFSSRRITRGDWQDYRDFYKGLKTPRHFSELMQGRNLEDSETYKALFAATIDRESYVMFGVWDRGKMVGQTSLFFESREEGKVAVFVGSERADDYRGQRLGDEFYRIRFQYLADQGFFGTVILSVHPDNMDSLKAANRHGFVETGEATAEGYIVMALVLREGESGSFAVETGFGQETDERMRTLFIITEPGNNQSADILIAAAMQEKRGKIPVDVARQLPANLLAPDRTIPEDFREAIRDAVEAHYLCVKGISGLRFVPGPGFLEPEPR